MADVVAGVARATQLSQFQSFLQRQRPPPPPPPPLPRVDAPVQGPQPPPSVRAEIYPPPDASAGEVDVVVSKNPEDKGFGVGLKTYGAGAQCCLIAMTVVRGGPFDRAGIRVSDQVCSVDGVAVSTTSGAREQFVAKSEVVVRVRRGVAKHAVAPDAQAPSPPPSVASPPPQPTVPLSRLQCLLATHKPEPLPPPSPLMELMAKEIAATAFQADVDADPAHVMAMQARANPDATFLRAEDAEHPQFLAELRRARREVIEAQRQEAEALLGALGSPQKPCIAPGATLRVSYATGAAPPAAAPPPQPAKPAAAPARPAAAPAKPAAAPASRPVDAAPNGQRSEAAPQGAPALPAQAAPPAPDPTPTAAAADEPPKQSTTGTLQVARKLSEMGAGEQTPAPAPRQLSSVSVSIAAPKPPVSAVVRRLPRGGPAGSAASPTASPPAVTPDNDDDASSADSSTAPGVSRARVLRELKLAAAGDDDAEARTGAKRSSASPHRTSKRARN
eukprot:TRINITY_DN3511_c1_g3_i1.p1 TRINITY_DN3511_c1_g3~~TRINITY_DN3511_c1_g3_i1.p1  ORF type:complete len:520 (+),score=127.65 TRINITY_DN3511_c1_g3_i1:53-1561(+)